MYMHLVLSSIETKKKIQIWSLVFSSALPCRYQTTTAGSSRSWNSCFSYLGSRSFTTFDRDHDSYNGECHATYRYIIQGGKIERNPV